MKIFLDKVKAGLYFGLDLATKSGWCFVKSDGTNVELIDYGSVSLPSNMSQLNKLKKVKEAILPILKKYLSHKLNTTVVIENCYLGKWQVKGREVWNPQTLKFLAWLEGYMICAVEENIKPEPIILTPYPSHARAVVGIKGTLSKDKIVEAVNNILLKKNIFKKVHNNIVDALILALYGGKV